MSRLILKYRFVRRGSNLFSSRCKYRGTKIDGLAKTSRSHFKVRQIVRPNLTDTGSNFCES